VAHCTRSTSTTPAAGLGTHDIADVAARLGFQLVGWCREGDNKGRIAMLRDRAMPGSDMPISGWDPIASGATVTVGPYEHRNTRYLIECTSGAVEWWTAGKD
jgi:hypothetical protein